MDLVMTKTVGEIAAENPVRIPLLEEFLDIHGLTNDLMPPTDACGSYRVLFQKAVVAGILD